MPSTNQTDGAKHIGPTATEKKFKRNKTNTNKKISELFAVIVSYSCCVISFDAGVHSSIIIINLYAYPAFKSLSTFFM